MEEGILSSITLNIFKIIIIETLNFTMNNFKHLLFLATFVLFVQKVNAQDTRIKDKPVYGAYGSDMRIRAGHGLINDYEYDLFPKLIETHYKKIGIMLIMPEEIDLSYMPFVSKNKYPKDLKFNLYKFSDSVLTKLIPIQSVPNIVKIDTSYAKLKIKTSGWDGTAKLPLYENKALLKSLEDQYGIEALLIIKGTELPDFIKGSPIKLAAQGLYKRGREYVYAGHKMYLFDVKTGKNVPHGFYVQSSADYTSLDFKNFDEYSPEELMRLEVEIKKRIKNNLEQSVKVIGLSQ